jgi:hypothetical protein
VFAGLIAFWVVSLDDPVDSSNAQETPPSSTSAEPTPSEEPEETTGAEAEETEPTEPTETADPTSAPADPAQAVTEFFAFIPGDLSAAYPLTSPAFQSANPYEDFAGFWDNFESVRIANVETESDTTALVDITYVEPGGASQTERHRMTFVRGEDGRLLLERDVIA